MGAEDNLAFPLQGYGHGPHSNLYKTLSPHPPPPWLKVRLKTGPNYLELKSMMRKMSLNTVCEEANCPNIFECWQNRTATFMILGDVCTRACRFCAVTSGKPTWNDPLEPERVARAVQKMNLST